MCCAPNLNTVSWAMPLRGNRVNILQQQILPLHQAKLLIYPLRVCIMKVHEKIRYIRESKDWTREQMAEKLNLSVNGYANIERGETDVQLSRLEQIAEVFGIELLELFTLGERNVFYWAGDNHKFIKFFLQSTNFSEAKTELEHELEKARLLLQQKDKEIAYLKEIINLMKKSCPPTQIK